jgi:1,4-alpha-glucan branching enzyme
MPGDDWQKFANLRLLYGYMFSQPGKKLLFMGSEFAQWQEWQHDEGLDWHLAQYDRHRGVQRLVADLNALYAREPALHQLDCEPSGFQWIDANDSLRSVLTYLRRGRESEDVVLVACNFTPVPRHNYRVGVPHGGAWRELINSDAAVYGGSGQGNFGGVEAVPVGYQGQPYSLVLTLPPLSVVMLKT